MQRSIHEPSSEARARTAAQSQRLQARVRSLHTTLRTGVQGPWRVEGYVSHIRQPARPTRTRWRSGGADCGPTHVVAIVMKDGDLSAGSRRDLVKSDSY